MGMLMIGLEGKESLTDADVRRIKHDLVGGVILFKHNNVGPDSLRRLIAEIRKVKPGLIIAVDQEGGEVQRLRKGFTDLPPMREIGQLYRSDPEAALQYAHDCGLVIAFELKDAGIDLSLTPVLDLDRGSKAIGNRAFAKDPAVVAELAGSLMDGLHAGGMIAVGKHFPGHGSAVQDTHKEEVRDPRSLEQIMESDIKPFAELIKTGKLDAVMTAHVIYPAVDKKPAGLSRLWVADILRRRLGFSGFVFSDDLAMAGSAVGDLQGVQAAFNAGCDMALVCKDFALFDRITADFDKMDSAEQEVWRKRAREALDRWREVTAKINRSATRDDYNAAVSRLATLQAGTTDGGRA